MLCCEYVRLEAVYVIIIIILAEGQPSAPHSSSVSQAHIIAPFNDVLKRVVLAILNSNELEPIT